MKDRDLFEIKEKIPYNVRSNIIGKTSKFTVLKNGNRLRLFINGVRSENNVSGSGNQIQNASAGVQIGRDGVDGGGATEGQIDDVRIWNRRIPDAEIAAIANAGCQ